MEGRTFMACSNWPSVLTSTGSVRTDHRVSRVATDSASAVTPLLVFPTPLLIRQWKGMGESYVGALALLENLLLLPFAKDYLYSSIQD
jgi:hypothetical protein